MLTIKNLSVSIEDTSILSALDLFFPHGTITAILGHNGSGKSSLALSLMWHPRYEVSGEILLNGENIVELSPSERHHKGIFLSFQNIPEIPGIQVIEYLRTIYNSHFSRENPDKKPPSLFVFKRMVEKLLPELVVKSEKSNFCRFLSWIQIWLFWMKSILGLTSTLSAFCKSKLINGKLRKKRLLLFLTTYICSKISTLIQLLF